MVAMIPPRWLSEFSFRAVSLDFEHRLAIRATLTQRWDMTDTNCKSFINRDTIDINRESIIKLSDVPSWCEEKLGNRIHKSTVTRWRLRGARGKKLATILAGGTRYTSHEALERFFAAVTAAADGHAVVSGVIRDQIFGASSGPAKSRRWHRPR